MGCAVGLYVGKYDNVPHSDNVIWKLVLGNNIEWSSRVRLLNFIFGVSCTVTPASLSKKVGIRLFFIEGTYRAFLTDIM